MRALYWKLSVPKNRINITDIDSGQTINPSFEKQVASEHPLVDRVWFTGSMSEDTWKGVVPRLNILSKNGKRFLSEEILTYQYESLDIPEAIEWINNLKPEN